MTRQRGAILRGRLAQFVIDVKQIADKLPTDYFYYNLKKQLLRSSGSAYMNFGEADGACSSRDFCNKLRISLKEIKESRHIIELLIRTEITLDGIQKVYQESDQLGAMLYSSIKTASRHHKPKHK